MKDDELRKILDRLEVPAPDEAARGRALDRALTAFRHREAKPAVEESGMKAWRWALAGAFLAVLAGVCWMLRGPSDILRPPGLVLDQMAALFPGRLDAVVEHGGDVDVRLSPEDSPSSQQPLMLVLTRGRDVVRVLSYSGRVICLDLDGKTTCLEVLVTENNDVIVAGKKFVWSRDNPAALNGYRIEANTLQPAS